MCFVQQIDILVAHDCLHILTTCRLASDSDRDSPVEQIGSAAAAVLMSFLAGHPTLVEFSHTAFVQHAVVH